MFYVFTMALTLVGLWSCGHPVGGSLSNRLTEQTRTNMSQPGRRPGIAVGDEQHFLQALWSSKDILKLRGGPWVCAVSALVFLCWTIYDLYTPFCLFAQALHRFQK